MRIKIKEKDGIHVEWLNQAKSEEISLEKLPEFLRHLTEDYEHDYGTIVYAMAAGMIATMEAMDRTPQGGITGFQAGCIGWEMIKEFMSTKKDAPLRLVDYSDLLYPQYECKFQKTITPDVWKYLKKEAKKLISKKNSDGVLANPDVKTHWKKISEGIVPFGITVKEI